MNLYHYIYVSKSSEPVTKAGLDKLIATATTRNKEAGLTGMLLHANGYFMQVLEGDKHFVLHYIEAIKKDPRHMQFTTLLEGTCQKRMFPNWSMGIINLNQTCQRNMINDAKVLFEFLDATDQKCVSKSTISALKYFRNRMDHAGESNDGETNGLSLAA